MKRERVDVSPLPSNNYIKKTVQDDAVEDTQPNEISAEERIDISPSPSNNPIDKKRYPTQ